MRRFHLFEWEDQPWLPAVFRDFITDHLHYGLTHAIRGSINRNIARRLRVIALRTQTRQIVDLCAGAGGPVLKIQRILGNDLKLPLDVVLTDLYPNIKAFRQHEDEGDNRVTARYESTSAFDVPVELDGLRTLFTALHHFEPNQVRLILADAVRKRQPIAIFEPLERTLLMTIKIVVFSLYQSFCLTPFVGRLSCTRFLLTYVLPLCPAIMAWDGMVSALRTYTPEELRNIAGGIEATDYKWDAGRFRNPGPLGLSVPTTFLVGFPTAPAVERDFESDRAAVNAPLSEAAEKLTAINAKAC